MTRYGFSVGTDLTPLLVEMLAGFLEPKAQRQRRQLLEGIKLISHPQIAQALNTLPPEQQAEIHQSLFTDVPDWSRRIFKGERNKTLLWPGEKEEEVSPEIKGTPGVPAKKVEEGLMAGTEIPGVPAMAGRPRVTRKVPVYFPTIREHGYPFTREEHREHEQFKEGLKVPAEKFVTPGSISTLTGKPFGKPPRRFAQPGSIDVETGEPFGEKPPRIVAPGSVNTETGEVYGTKEHPWPYTETEKKSWADYLAGGRESPEDRREEREEAREERRMDKDLDRKVNAEKANLSAYEGQAQRLYDQYILTLRQRMVEHNRMARTPRFDEKGKLLPSPPPISDLTEFVEYMPKDDWMARTVDGRALLKKIMESKGRLHYLLTGQTYPSAPPTKPTNPTVPPKRGGVRDPSQMSNEELMKELRK